MLFESHAVDVQSITFCQQGGLHSALRCSSFWRPPLDPLLHKTGLERSADAQMKWLSDSSTTSWDESNLCIEVLVSAVRLDLYWTSQEPTVGARCALSTPTAATSVARPWSCSHSQMPRHGNCLETSELC